MKAPALMRACGARWIVYVTCSPFRTINVVDHSTSIVCGIMQLYNAACVPSRHLVGDRLARLKTAFSISCIVDIGSKDFVSYSTITLASSAMHARRPKCRPPDVGTYECY